jgi:hypothetical protein
MRMVTFAVTAAFVAACGVFGITAPGQTAPTTAPAAVTLAATAPAAAQTKDQDAIHATLRDFFRAVMAGDDKTAGTFLDITDPKNQKTADAMLSRIAAEQRLRNAIMEQFPNETPEAIHVGMPKDEIAKFEQSFDSAKVTVKGDAAEAVIEPGMGATSYNLVLKGGQWKIDFDKTQTALGMPDDKEVEAAKKSVPGYDKLTADVKARKYQTLKEINNLIAAHEINTMTTTRDNESAVGMPATAPATMP